MQPYEQQAPQYQQQGAGCYPPQQQPMLSPPGPQILYAPAPPQSYPAGQVYSSPMYAPVPVPMHGAPAPYYPQQQGMMGAASPQPQPYFNGQPGIIVTSAPQPLMQPQPMQQPPQQPQQQQMMMAPAPSVPASSSSPGAWRPQANSDDGVFPFSELTIHRVIGDGTFGTVSAGEFRSTPVAIKTLKQTVFTPQQWEEFMSEVKFLYGFFSAAVDTHDLLLSIEESCVIGERKYACSFVASLCVAAPPSCVHCGCPLFCFPPRPVVKLVTQTSFYSWAYLSTPTRS